MFWKEREQRQLEEKFEAEYKAMEAAFVEELGVGNSPSDAKGSVTVTVH